MAKINERNIRLRKNISLLGRTFDSESKRYIINKKNSLKTLAAIDNYYVTREKYIGRQMTNNGIIYLENLIQLNEERAEIDNREVRIRPCIIATLVLTPNDNVRLSIKKCEDLLYDSQKLHQIGEINSFNREDLENDPDYLNQKDMLEKEKVLNSPIDMDYLRKFIFKNCSNKLQTLENVYDNLNKNDAKTNRDLINLLAKQDSSKMHVSILRQYISKRKIQI